MIIIIPTQLLAGLVSDWQFSQFDEPPQLHCVRTMLRNWYTTCIVDRAAGWSVFTLPNASSGHTLCLTADRHIRQTHLRRAGDQSRFDTQRAETRSSAFS